MSNVFIDCHAHLFFRPIPSEAIKELKVDCEIPKPSKEFISRNIQNAKEAGVSHIVGVISNPNDFTRYTEQLALKNIIHVIGVSRDNATTDNTQNMIKLEKIINFSKPCAIGEIGLDYSNSYPKLNENDLASIKKRQQNLFRLQIQLAKEIDVPIVIHAGYGDDKDILAILKEENASEVGGQVHGYMSNKIVVKELLDMGFYFSFGYSHIQNKELKQIIEFTPLELLLIETDSPYHLMESPRKFILSEDVIAIYEGIAKIKDVEINLLANQVMYNAREIFSF